MTGLAFLDTETVMLEPGPDVLWEVGVITRDPGRADQEWLFQLRPNMAKADPESLRISRFQERYLLEGKRCQALAWHPFDDPGKRPAQLTYGALAYSLDVLLRGRHVVGSVPNFDTERLSAFLRKQLKSPAYRDPWHYHLIDVENLVVGYLAGHPGPDAPTPPWSSEDLSRAVGVQPPEDDKDRHTALGDARWARAVYDAVMGGVR